MATITDEEWQRRYEEHLVEAFMKHDREYEAQEQAMLEEKRKRDPGAMAGRATLFRKAVAVGTAYAAMARATFEAVDMADHRHFFEDDPEGAADEEMSYWGD